MEPQEYPPGYPLGIAKVAESLACLTLEDATNRSNPLSSDGASTNSPSGVFSNSGSLNSPWSSNGAHLPGTMSKLEDDEDVASFVATAAASSVLYESEKSLQFSDNDPSGLMSITSKLSHWESTLNDAADVWGFPVQQSGVSFPWNALPQRSLSTGEWSTPLVSNVPPRGKDSSQSVGRSFSLTDEPSSLGLAMGEDKFEPFLNVKDFVMQEKPTTSVPENTGEQKQFLRSMYSAPSGLMWNMSNNGSIQRLSPAQSGDSGPSGSSGSNFLWDRQESLTSNTASGTLSESMTITKPQSEMNPASETLIQSKILDAKGEYWGRTPVDQTTTWTVLPGNNVADMFDCNKSSTESNVWANEPPNGTRLWEEHYEMQGLIRNGRSGMKPIGQSQSQQRITSNSNVPVPYQPTSPGKLWSTATTNASWEGHVPPVSLQSSAGMSENIGWPSSHPFNSNSYGNSSESRRSISNIQAQHPTQMTTPGPSGLGHMSPSNLPRIKSDMTMRVQQVKYLCSLGFPRAEAQNALIMNNMDLDRALLELRERFGGNGASGVLHHSTSNDLAMGYVNGLSHASGRLPLNNAMNDYSSGDINSSTPHLGQQITQQFQYALNNRINSMNPIAAPSSMGPTSSMSSRGLASGAEPQSAANKLWQNYMLLQNRLKQINGEMNHLQASPLLTNQGGGNGSQQLQMAYRNLYAQQQQLYQQISILQTQLKSLAPTLLSSVMSNTSPTNSGSGAPYPVAATAGTNNLPGYMDSMSYGGMGAMGGGNLTRHLSQPYGGMQQHMNDFSLQKANMVGGPMFPGISSINNASTNPSNYGPPLPISPPQSIFDSSGTNFNPPWQR